MKKDYTNNFKITKSLYIALFLVALFSNQVKAQGTWTPLTNMPPDNNTGVMLLLSDGTVIAKTNSGGFDGSGNVWDKLTPDSLGSYVNGTWSTIAPMHDTRLYFSSQVLKDGRVYVAGGEYGTGGSNAEVYNPLTDIWTMAPSQGTYMGDANSEILPDGRVLEALLDTVTYNYDVTAIYNPVTNTWSAGSSCYGPHDESAWVKLADSSILFIETGSRNSERYIPALNQWVVDAIVPDSLYDQYWDESGAGFLLPNGQAFFLGSTGHTAYYTPTGNTSPGTWTAGPDFPITYGKEYGTIDAAAAMMVNGKILCTASPINTGFGSSAAFYSPTAFYEFDYLANSFTQINAPDGTDTLSISCFETNMLCLPDGNILYSTQYSPQYYVYTPSGAPLAAGKPTIGNITQTACDTFKITGTLFNGISEGAGYGDDWQMATNYPIIRLTNGAKVYYARTFNWNSTGVQTGNMPDTTLFSIPSTLPYGTYSLVVTANGISSDPVTFINNSCTIGINKIASSINQVSVYPNPNNGMFSIETNSLSPCNVFMYDVNGKLVLTHTVTNGKADIDASSLNNGVYNISIISKDGVANKRLVITR